ncbi:MAG: rhodanese-like domain-containing protein [Planctomycetes bacterium]|nr:rhodanese-like domain-containing protein [Planctomycetota bacterium]
MAAQRIGPQEAKQHVESGDALLVCAYDSDEKFQKNRLEGAISLDDFRSQADSVPKDREIIFYCA